MAMSVAGGLAGQGGTDLLRSCRPGVAARWPAAESGCGRSGCIVSAAGHVEGLGAEATDAPAAAVSPPHEGAVAPGVWAADLARAQCPLGPLHGADDDHWALGWS